MLCRTVFAVMMVFAFVQNVFTAEESLHKKALALFNERNYKDALEIFQKLAVENQSIEEAIEDYNKSIDCLNQLARIQEFDAFAEKVAGSRLNSWRILKTVAVSYMNVQHNGYMIAGKFERGQHRGGGEYAQSFDRDRVRALQLFIQAMTIAEKEVGPAGKYDFYLSFANAVMQNNGSAWKLQYLTDTTILPDYEKGYYYGYGGAQGAPATEAGDPILYYCPANFADSKNDGERWRWLLKRAKDSSPENASAKMSYFCGYVDLIFADFLWSQFDVQTLASSSYFGGRGNDSAFAGAIKLLSSLSEDETLAKLATGIKRYSLPREFNYIKIYQTVSQINSPNGETALNKLAEIFSNRMQYVKAAQMWDESIKRFGPGYNDCKKKALDQIVGNWAVFENIRPQPYKKDGELFFKFRNANEASFEARKIDTAKFLDDLKAYLKTKPSQLDWQKTRVESIGMQILKEGGEKYFIGSKIEWNEKLEPAADHFDKTVKLSVPIKEPGAYFITSKLKDGNTSRIILWIADTAIVLKNGTYFVCDAQSGIPVKNAALDFFGYKMDYKYNDKKPSSEYSFDNFKAATDENGFYNFNKVQSQLNWIVTASDSGNRRFAFLGFDQVWIQGNDSSKYDMVKAYMITDRPVYLPGDSVKIKFWLRRALYDDQYADEFAEKKFMLKIRDPSGTELVKSLVTTDKYGGVEFEFSMQKNAKLGNYGVTLSTENMKNYFGGGNFRVEEYKKPEFEVTVKAPEEPIKLGDEITAQINAKYYFGAPVTNAKVKYKVQRTEHDSEWYPFRSWDWLYGRGYWWFYPESNWLRGWDKWGCKCPSPWWVYRYPQQPELVAENEVNINPDGTFTVKIDTSIAKELFGDKDQKYEIIAEVTDESRRTIVGKGSVIAAAHPFKVTVWTDKGFYRSGEEINAKFAARTPDGKPVKGEGTVTLFKLEYPEDSFEAKEKSVREWPVSTDDAGMADLKMDASAQGQFRISCKIKDSKGNMEEGGCVISVTEGKDNKNDFRFNKIEIICEKPEYQPGEKARLLINSEKEGAYVLLYVRPEKGNLCKPVLLKLNGKSAVYEVGIEKADMPNIFVEAVTVFDGNAFSVTKSLVVPPEKKVLNVEIKPSKERYLPGEKANGKIRVTDFFGKPVTGTVVVTIYDKSLEYISGGSNLSDIKDFFWKWKRQYYSSLRTNFDWDSYNILNPNEITLQSLGIFGAYASEIKEQGSLSFQSKSKGGFVRGLAGAPSEPKRARSADAVDIKKMSAEADGISEGESGGEVAEAAEVYVRSKFADTALWIGKLETDANGEAEIQLQMPENLTTWKVKAWSLTQQTQVGQGETEVITSKNLIIRLQSPRFFVETDSVTLSANIHNYLDKAVDVRAVLEVEGGALEISSGEGQSVNIESKGEARVNWQVKAVKEGEATIRMKALCSSESDAMEMKFPVLVHGFDKMVSVCGNIRPDGETAKFAISVPEKRKIEESRFELRYSPTLAGAMLESLPYLVGYPYGCTEVTLNRFLPAAITKKVLLDMGINLADVAGKLSNLNAQEIGRDSERIEQWKKMNVSPVFDEKELNGIIQDSLTRLGAMQLSDGGWGWFSGYGEWSSPHTTALVVHGLLMCRKNNVKVDENMLSRGIQWLKSYQAQELVKIKNAPSKTEPYKPYADNLDALVYMVLSENKSFDKEMKTFLLRDKKELSVYGLSLIGIAFHEEGDQENRDKIITNIKQYLVEDNENQTAYLRLPQDHFWWFWYGSEIETQAFFLKLVVAAEPKGDLAPKLVKYLLNNRKHSTYWDSTRDTAYCIEAFADFMRSSGEDAPDMTVEVKYDGKTVKTVKIDKSNLFTFDNKFVMKGNDVTSGEHNVEIVKKGRGPLYYNSYLSYFTLEDFITKAGLEIKVERKYYRLKETTKKVQVQGKKGNALTQNQEKYDREEISDKTVLKSGDMVEVELVIESKNDYEYIIFEDMKPAGFEASEVRSGYNGNALNAYVEFHNEKVCFFVRALARGKHSVAYRVRAEIPGSFSALPTKASAMYAPELRANSDEFKTTIKDK